MKEVRDRLVERFAAAFPATAERRIGAELKFPLVQRSGAIVPRDCVDALWSHLVDEGWEAETDPGTDRVVGARIAGERNHSVASCETGYAKTEFSLAHVADLDALEAAVDRLVETLLRFSDREDVIFLCHGIFPVDRPGRHLLMRKERASFWDRAMPCNDHVPPEEGDDVHLLTVNAGSHVHVAVDGGEVIDAVNALNGFAGAQIACCAHSSVWRGTVDPAFVAVAEDFWDRWAPARGRCGVPPRPFADLPDYVDRILGLAPVYVRRPDGPVILWSDYDSFLAYYASDPAHGRDLDGRPVALTPGPDDLRLHNSCYWYDARISRYYTVENRTCEQQPPADLLLPAALTLGLVENAAAARAALDDYAWDDLRAARPAACRAGPAARVGGTPVRELAERLHGLARDGLVGRGRGEERHLEPLARRLADGSCPGLEAAATFDADGLPALLDRLDLRRR